MEGGLPPNVFNNEQKNMMAELGLKEMILNTRRASAGGAGTLTASVCWQVDRQVQQEIQLGTEEYAGQLGSESGGYSPQEQGAAADNQMQHMQLEE